MCPLIIPSVALELSNLLSPVAELYQYDNPLFRLELLRTLPAVVAVAATVVLARAVSRLGISHCVSPEANSW